MVPNSIRRIVIVGGGTAGWMAAAGLASCFKNLAAPMSVVLIESAAIAPVGVGEASLPGLKTFNQSIGLSESEFIRETHASFKLAIQFVGWRQREDIFFHPFAKHGLDIEGIDFHHYWLHARAAGNPAPFGDFSLSTALCMQDRFAPPIDKPENSLSDYKYAYHFDASLYAVLLRRKAIAMGVEHLQANVNTVQLCIDSGFIESVSTDQGVVVAGDLFIDCSGFKGLLIEGALNTGYEDWSHWLPCNSAVAIQTQRTLALTPYTQSIAQAAGWRWRIPLQNRVGNGYVYSSAFTSDAAAEQQLRRDLEGAALTDARLLKFTTGMRKKFWNKNCVALGLSAGFIEPLESTSISLIQTGIIKLLMCFPDAGFNQHLIAEANRLSRLEFERIRDFIILHYCATERDDTEFWRYLRQMSIPDTLAHKMEVFRAKGLLVNYENESFQRESWVALFLGMGIVPEQIDQRVAASDPHQLSVYLDSIKQAIARGSMTAPTHEMFLRSNQLLAI